MASGAAGGARGVEEEEEEEEEAGRRTQDAGRVEANRWGRDNCEPKSSSVVFPFGCLDLRLVPEAVRFKKLTENQHSNSYQGPHTTGNRGRRPGWLPTRMLRWCILSVGPCSQYVLLFRFLY